MKNALAHDPVPARSDAVPLLYLGGCGRSGSTLLDRMLGQAPDVCSLGEIGHLWKALLTDQECGCRTPIRRCAFWRAVGDVAFGGWDALDVGAVLALQRTVVRQRHVPLMVAPAAWPPYGRRADRYGRLLLTLYRAIRDVSGAALLVNSTKHYANAFFLTRIPGLDLRVLHLVRDSRGVAFSWTKSVDRPEEIHRGARMNRYSPGRSSRRWLGYNWMFETLARLGVPSTLVRYEDVVRSPATTVARILGDAGVPPGDTDLAFIRSDEVDLRPNHTVAGNPMRFRVGRVRLRVDDEWKRSFPSADRRLVGGLTWPLLVRYGYAGRSATS